MVSSFNSKIKLNTPIESIRRKNNKVFIKPLGHPEKTFDAVVIATHSDQALRMLSDPTNEENEILEALPFQQNKALLHNDISVLPKRKNAWSSWNYNLDQGIDKPMAMTYNMNILQSLKSFETYCVTLNNDELVDDKRILKKLSYQHPQFTPEGIDAQNRKDEISGVKNTYYCGAYWRNGFHEDGVVSALDVCKKFGISL